MGVLGLFIEQGAPTLYGLAALAFIAFATYFMVSSAIKEWRTKRKEKARHKLEMDATESAMSSTMQEQLRKKSNQLKTEAIDAGDDNFINPDDVRVGVRK